MQRAGLRVGRRMDLSQTGNLFFDFSLAPSPSQSPGNRIRVLEALGVSSAPRSPPNYLAAAEKIAGFSYSFFSRVGAVDP